MSWSRFDDGFHDHPKILKAGNAAAGVFAKSVTWSNRNLTDGRIPAHVVPLLCHGDDPAAIVKRLTDAGEDGNPGLWIPTATGFVINDYLDYNPSAKDVKKHRKSVAARVAKHRQTKRLGNSPVTRYGGVSLGTGTGAGEEASGTEDSTPRARDNVAPASSEPRGNVHPYVDPTFGNGTKPPSIATEAPSTAAAVDPPSDGPSLLLTAKRHQVSVEPTLLPFVQLYEGSCLSGSISSLKLRDMLAALRPLHGYRTIIAHWWYALEQLHGVPASKRCFFTVETFQAKFGVYDPAPAADAVPFGPRRAETATSTPLSAEEAWPVALTHVRRRKPPACDPESGALVLQAIKLLGGMQAIERSTNEDVTRSAFWRCYNRVLEQRQRVVPIRRPA